MNDLDNALRYIKKARGLIQNFAMIDPTLWPVLSEIDLALSRGEVNHRVLRGHEPVDAGVGTLPLDGVPTPGVK